MKSWKPEVTADASGKWYPNGVAFRTQAEAHTYVIDLSMRWFAVRETREVESDDEPNYQIVDGVMSAIK